MWVVGGVALKLGSLFDGISAFPLAAQRNGITPVWASEIEPFPIEVSRRRFPNMKHLGSVTDIHGGRIEPVDIITFGSPCQDLSVAGRREGLDGERSGLFYEAIRIILEMQEATYGEYPTFAIWENVFGAFSSNGGEDFARVLSEMAGAEIYCPEEGWPNAGIVFGPRGQVAWRVFDAQYWGVPQRRRRVKVIADFRGERAGEILFVEQGLPRDIEAGGKTREEVAAGVGDGAETTGTLNADYCGFVSNQSVDAGHILVHPKIVGTLCANGAGMNRPAGMASETDLIVAQCLTTGTGRRYCPESETLIPVYAFSAGQSAKAGSIGFQEGIAPTLRGGASGTNQVATILDPIAFNGRQDPVSGRVTGALDADGGTQCIAIQHSMIGRKPEAGPQGKGYREDGMMFTLDSRGDSHVVCYPEPANTLLGKGNLSFHGDQDNLVSVDYRVRRLTPTECERLMGFPDGWTEGGSDTARYKAIGNSIAIPVLEWIFSQLVKVVQKYV